MKKLILSLLVLLLAGTSHAQNSGMGACGYPASALKSAYKEMLTVNGATLLTSATYKPTNGDPAAVCAVLVVNTNSVSWWSTGSVPTASDGIITTSGNSISIGALDLARFQMIKAGASNAEVAVLYFVPVQ